MPGLRPRCVQPRNEMGQSHDTPEASCDCCICSQCPRLRRRGLLRLIAEVLCSVGNTIVAYLLHANVGHYARFACGVVDVSRYRSRRLAALSAAAETSAAAILLHNRHGLSSAESCAREA